MLRSFTCILLTLVFYANALPIKVIQPGADSFITTSPYSAERCQMVSTIKNDGLTGLPLGSPSPDLPRLDVTASEPGITATVNPKYVVAHHMVGNTYSYTLDDWAEDIALAHAAGIDGFALNVGRDEWQPGRVADAYEAAANSSTDFKLFMSFDMSSLLCTSAADAQLLRKYITAYASHPNQLKINGAVFVSTFAGESCTFGQASVVEGWSTQFKSHAELSGKNAVHFVPSFFVDPRTFGSFDRIMDGDFNFNSGWPIELTTFTAQSFVNATLAALSQDMSNVLDKFVGSNVTDLEHLSALRKNTSDNPNASRKTYMAAVSPWFFTHYGPESYNKNFMYLSDAHLYPTRWGRLISMRDQVDVVEIVSWNDYGESHYIGPIKGAQPMSQAWVDGLNHTGWLDMTKYFAEAFKTGKYPNVTEDRIYMWARTHPRNANASTDSVGRPTNYELTQDILWALVMSTSPCNVTLTTSNSTSQTFSVSNGVTRLSVPLTAGGFMRGQVERNGQTILDLRPENYTFDPNPTAYNFNAFVAYTGMNSL